MAKEMEKEQFSNFATMKGLWWIVNIVLLTSLRRGDCSNIEGIVDASESVKEEVEAFYRELKEILNNSDQFRMYSKRVDCMMKELRSKKTAEHFYKFIQPRRTPINESVIMIQLETFLDKANFSCKIIGCIAVIFICSILIIVVSCVACISKK
jgi:hypothetical protein